jgi:hypothetical protein
MNVLIIFNRYQAKPLIFGQKGADVHSGTTNVPLHFFCSNLFITCVRRRGGGTSQLVLPYQDKLYGYLEKQTTKQTVLAENPTATTGKSKIGYSSI